jgi:general secretion pathway protein D
MLEKLISGYMGVEAKSITSGGGPGESRGYMGSRGEMRPPEPSGGPGGTSAGVISIKGEKKPILIIPDPRRSSIVVAAPSNVLEQIKKWLVTLDQSKPVTTKEEILEVKSDVEELANQLNTMLNSYPDESLRNALKIFPFPSSRRLMIAGSEQNRKLIKTWLAQIDIEDAGQQVTRTFKLQYADAKQIADNLKELFSDDTQSRRYRWWTSGGRQDRTAVSVTANERNNSITVLTSPERMIKVEKQLKEWDKPFEGKEAEPRIYTLKYADPDKTKDLLESLFSKKDKSRSMPWWWYDEDEQDSSPAPVGRLYGQFRFEAYADTGKLVVVSKNADNYKIIDDLIAKIDLPQMAGMPRIIQLKFAEAEALAEQLNALLNAPGTPASILRRSLAKPFQSFGGVQSPYYNNDNGNSSPQPQQQQQQGSDITQMVFWWQTPPVEIRVKQPSNLIGKLRIVPNVEQNLLMICAPEEYAQAIEDYVHKLDQPGYRVLIQAVIAAVVHDDMTSLGYRFSSDPSLFTTGSNADITENALRGLLNYTWTDNFGKENTISLDVDVNNLISLLRRVTDLKIKSQPKILAADNVEAEFFDGQDVPFISHVQTFDTGAKTEDFKYFPVGIRLRVRPHITKDRNIDLTVNLLVSNLVPGVTLFGGAVVDRRETTTRIVLEDGKTFLISGILREEEHAIIRRVPGLGDIPGLGELFKHREMAKVNSELLIFLTPHVIGPKGPYNKISCEPVEKMDMLMETETQAEKDMRSMKMGSPFPADTQPALCPAPSEGKK